ncbi:serine protease Do [Limimonas halophila]|uniref:Probable periplasmic serine endoprotease DegP-like n=1 Tax=Limimonas halophila TaxID=1082479 RepID=A0A1G7SYR8_9PROT|nr:DegQ family serine endoprotease [Limimonas halophila]SDG28205.1 serine protease Do [Limimonas halophila]
MTVAHLTRALASAAVALALATTAQAQQKAPDTFAPLAQKLLPGVVNISTTQTVEGRGGMLGQLPEGHPLREFFEQFGGAPQQERERELRSLGSGFVIDEEGYVVTNHHVVKKADEVTVILQDDTQIKAEIVGSDPETDLALLKIDADKELTALSWGDSEKARIGDWVLAIGNPFGLGGSVTAGIVSARGRDINAGPYSRYIQTDTAINQGNSGGPLFNMDGQVIGVNTAILSPSGGSVGVGFALPASVAEPVIADLREDGKVSRGWLGVTVQPVTEQLAKGLELDAEHGALVGGVADGAPAQKAGLKTGDVILELEGEKVADSNDLARRVARFDPGESVEMTVWRDGETITRTVELGERPSAAAEKAPTQKDEPDTKQAAMALGAKLAPANAEVLGQFDLPRGVDGAVVVEVARNGPAASRGIRPGDVVAQVGQTEVTSPGDVYGYVNEALERGADSVVLLVQRDDGSHFVPVPLAKPEE